MRDFGFVVEDSRLNCSIPPGYYKVWVPKSDYLNLLEEINGVGGNIGNLSYASYALVVKNCDLYRYITKDLSRPLVDEGTMNSYIGCDTPNELTELRVGKTNDNRTVLTQGKEWLPQSKNLSLLSCQEKGNELTSISVLNTSEQWDVPDFQYYPEGSYFNIPPGTKVIVDTDGKFILGGAGVGYFSANPVPKSSAK